MMNSNRTERGGALVEAAFIFPMLIMLVFGVIDVSRAFFDAAKVQEAAQEGAVYVALNPTQPTDAITRAEEAIQDIDFTGSVTVTCPASDQVTVTVSYTFQLVTPVVKNLLGDTFDLSHGETAQVLSPDACVPSP